MASCARQGLDIHCRQNLVFIGYTYNDQLLVYISHIISYKLDVYLELISMIWN